MTAQSHLFQLIASYLGQDMDLWADSEDQAIALYARENSDAALRGVLDDIAALRGLPDGTMRTTFMEHHGGDFDPGPSDQDALRFLNKVDAIISQALKDGSPTH